MTPESTCPGCGLRMPTHDTIPYEGYYHTSPECWSVCTEVLGREFSNVVLYGHAHQLTVDAYAVQHAGGRHPDKSVAIHLVGLHLMIDRGLRPTSVPAHYQQLASTVKKWPHFPPPPDRGALTIFDLAMADSSDEHIRIVGEWSNVVWGTWSPHHGAVADLVDRHLSISR